MIEKLSASHSAAALLETAILFLWRVKNDGSDQNRVHQKARYKHPPRLLQNLLNAGC